MSVFSFIPPVATGVGTNAFKSTGAFGFAPSVKAHEINNDESLCSEKKLLTQIRLK